MHDVLAGGVLVSTSRWQRSFRRKQRAARQRQRIASGRPAPRHKVNVQPGQLSSPLLKFGFPSLAVH